MDTDAGCTASIATSTNIFKLVVGRNKWLSVSAARTELNTDVVVVSISWRGIMLSTFSCIFCVYVILTLCAMTSRCISAASVTTIRKASYMLAFSDTHLRIPTFALCQISVFRKFYLFIYHIVENISHSNTFVLTAVFTWIIYISVSLACLLTRIREKWSRNKKPSYVRNIQPWKDPERRLCCRRD